MVKKVSIICPARNEFDSVNALVNAIRSIRKLAYLQFGDVVKLDFIIVDNASSDGTVPQLLTELETDENIQILSHVRNLGLQNSILTGLMNSKSDAAIVLQFDLQDPPDLVITMIQKWLTGTEYIVTKIRRRNSGYLDSIIRTIGYTFLNFVAGVKILANSGDFWLIDRKIIDQVLASAGLRPFFRTLIPRFKSPDEIIVYDRLKRASGKSNFDLLGKYEFFIDALLSDPRRILAVSMLCSTMLFLAAGILIAIPFTHQKIGLTLLSVWLLASLILIFLGLILEFIWRMYTEGTSSSQSKTHQMKIIRAI